MTDVDFKLLEEPPVEEPTLDGPRRSAEPARVAPRDRSRSPHSRAQSPDGRPPGVWRGNERRVVQYRPRPFPAQRPPPQDRRRTDGPTGNPRIGDSLLPGEREYLQTSIDKWREERARYSKLIETASARLRNESSR